MEPNNDEEEHSNDMHEEKYIPSILIDRSLLTCIKKPKSTKSYYVDNNIFYDEDNFECPEEYIQFQLYVTKRSNNQNFFIPPKSEEYFWTPPASSDEESSEAFIEEDISIETVENGVILNKMIYLTHLKWNAIVEVDADLYQCLLCDSILEEREIKMHIKLEEHTSQLEICKPFTMDSSVLRIINEDYHCAVCNIIVTIGDIGHFTSESHEEKLLEATLDSIENNNTDVQNRNNDNFNESDDEDFNGKYNAGHANNRSNLAISYASIAKTQKITETTPKFIENVFGNRKVKIAFECWHMIIRPKRNTFYCMACKDYYMLRNLAEHCKNSMHLEILKRCTIIDSYPDFFIRQVDGKFCHCAHCNSLQITHDIADHINIVHSRKHKDKFENIQIIRKNAGKDLKDFSVTCDIANKAVRNEVLENVKTNNFNNEVIEPPKKLPECIRNTVVQLDDSVTYSNDLGEPIFAYIICGHRIHLPIISFNVVCLRKQDFYCGLCDLVSAGDLASHILSFSHLYLLRQTPFLFQFSYNAIRLIRGAMHCAVCNMPVEPIMIYQHLQSQHHKKLLFIALTSGNINDNASIADKEVKTTSNDKIENDKVDKEVKIQINDKIENDKSKDEVVKRTNNKHNDKHADQKMKVVKIKNHDVTIKSDDKGDSKINWECHVYVKLNETYFKISFGSYNSLINTGDGAVYCFLCSARILLGDIRRHIESSEHSDKIKQSKFLGEYEGTLLRQVYITFHCATCNVIVLRNDIKKHMSWPDHIATTEISKSHCKKNRQKRIKRGALRIEADTVKELKYLDVEDPKDEIIARIKGNHKTDGRSNIKTKTDHSDVEKNKDDNRKNKIIIIQEDILKISWEHWHGLASKSDEDWRCILCQEDVKELEMHANNANHKKAVMNPLVDQTRYLLRFVNDNTLHCITCNVEVSNREHIIKEHTEGKRHMKAQDTIKEASSQENAYTDCDEDVVNFVGTTSQ